MAGGAAADNGVAGDDTHFELIADWDIPAADTLRASSVAGAAQVAAWVAAQDNGQALAEIAGEASDSLRDYTAAAFRFGDWGILQLKLIELVASFAMLFRLLQHL